jgi:hypothetical protein
MSILSYCSGRESGTIAGTTLTNRATVTRLHIKRSHECRLVSAAIILPFLYRNDSHPSTLTNRVLAYKGAIPCGLI